MSRSRKGLFGLLALFAVAIFGVTGCSDPGVEGWHDASGAGQPFIYKEPCAFRVATENLLGGAKRAYIQDTSVGGVCPGPRGELRILKVSCAYVPATLNDFRAVELDGDTCPRVQPGSTYVLVWINAAYVQPPIVQG